MLQILVQFVSSLLQERPYNAWMFTTGTFNQTIRFKNKRNSGSLSHVPTLCERYQTNHNIWRASRVSEKLWMPSCVAHHKKLKLYLFLQNETENFHSITVTFQDQIGGAGFARDSGRYLSQSGRALPRFTGVMFAFLSGTPNFRYLYLLLLS